MQSLISILFFALAAGNGHTPQFSTVLHREAASCLFDRLGTKNWLFKDAVVIRIQGKPGSEVAMAAPERKYDWEKNTAASSISVKIAAGKVSVNEESAVSELASRPGEKERAVRLALACRAALVEAMAYRTRTVNTYVLFASEGISPQSRSTQDGFEVIVLPGDASSALTIKLSRTYSVLDIRVHY